jgi:hypothetical protein
MPDTKRDGVGKGMKDLKLAESEKGAIERIEKVLEGQCGSPLSPTV